MKQSQQTLTQDSRDTRREGQPSREGWRGLVGSVIGFTNAATFFSIQQMQNMAGFFTDSRGSINRLNRAVDSMSEAMNNEDDGSKRSAVHQMNRTANEAINAIDSPDNQAGHNERYKAAANGGSKRHAAANGGSKRHAAANGGRKRHAAANGGRKRHAAANGGSKRSS